ncbi:MAG: hypothetical protein PVG66_11130 [Chromatiales bacterium]|jgi:hypothetical protein
MSQSPIMAVLLNGIAQLEYDRRKTLTEKQMDYLDQMDEKMDGGIEIAGKLLDSPDAMARVKFVSSNLLHAIKGDDEVGAAAFCAYIATRMPELKQVKITDLNDEVSIELVFDQEYRKQVTVSLDTLQ